MSFQGGSLPGNSQRSNLCNRKSAALNVGKWETVEHQRVLQSTRLTLAMLQIKLVLKLDILFTI